MSQQDNMMEYIMNSKASGYIMSQLLSIECNQNMNCKTDGCIMDQLVKYRFLVYLKRQKIAQCQNVLIVKIYALCLQISTAR